MLSLGRLLAVVAAALSMGPHDMASPPAMDGLSTRAMLAFGSITAKNSPTTTSFVAADSRVALSRTCVSELMRLLDAFATNGVACPTRHASQEGLSRGNVRGS